MEPIVYNDAMSDKEINRLVHQHVFGNPAAFMVPPYCDDPSRWWRVVEKMAERNQTITLSVFRPDRNSLALIGDSGIDCGKMGRSVCVASLIHLGVMVDPEDAKENATISSMVASAESLAAAAGVGIDVAAVDPPKPCHVAECELPAGTCCG